jgi:hypothetical protein
MSTEYCRHVRPNGTRCRSYALNGEPRCFWHNSLQQGHLAVIASPYETPPDDTGPVTHPLPAGHRAPRPLEIHFPELEDRASIQLALSMLLAALGHNLIDPRRAGAMLYGLQVASANVRDIPDRPTYIVRSSSIDEHGQPLAPDEDPQEIIDAELLLEQCEADDRMAEQDEEDNQPFMYQGRVFNK